MFTPGDPVPWFVARSSVNSKFHLDTVAGRWIVLTFFGSAADPASRQVLDGIHQNQERFDVDNACFFGVSTDPEDERQSRVVQRKPGIIWFWDFDRAICQLYGASIEGQPFRPHSLILDTALRVVEAIPFEEDIENHVPKIMEVLDQLPPIQFLRGHAPVIVVPGIFEPDFCRMLIQLYEQHGGVESGFMRDVDGKTVEIKDYGHKRRSDYDITDQNVIKAAQLRLHRRLVSEIRKAFQFNATRIERHIVVCYDADTEGHFRPHRDNTTRGTAHRRFAVTINLNAEEYEGGDLRFPEFGPRTYRAPSGGAVVFSCSLLHEATTVTSGKRFAFVPFLYDDEAAQIRQANLKYLAENPPG